MADPSVDASSTAAGDVAGTWKDYFVETAADILVYAAKEPYQFLYYVLLCLSPLFAISAFLSWKLAKAIEKEGKERKKKQKREASIAKAKRKAD